MADTPDQTTNAPREDVFHFTDPKNVSFDAYPDWLKARLEWFRTLKFGLFIHWGIYSQWGCIESWPLVEADTWARPDDLACWTERGKDLERFRREYRALNQTFNPVRFAPEEWAQIAVDAGMKYLNFTTKHHDGFCMWDTATTEYRITHPSSPFHANPRADIVKHVFDAFRARELAISCYFSKSDWHCPWYWAPGRPAPDRNPNYDTLAEPQLWEPFVQFVHTQIRELMSTYGHIDVLWLDGGQVRPPKQDIRMDEIADMARALQPHLLIADRTVGGPHENIITPEQEIPPWPMKHPWEACLTLGHGWSYRPNDAYKPTARVLESLIDIVSKGGNCLLNVGVAPDGHFPDEARERLAEIGRWLSVNGEAIYGSKVVKPYKSGAVRFTGKGESVYALVPRSEVEKGRTSWAGHRPIRGSKVELLGHGPISWKGKGGRIRTGALPTGDAPYFVFRFSEEQASAD
jgi:alpha-L-fucosidase